MTRTRAVSMMTPVALVLVSIAAGFAVGNAFGDSGIPKEVVLYRGAILGSVNALLAVALVFAFRATRVVNFSQASFGALSVFLYLVLRDAWQWAFWPALGASLAASISLALLSDLFILRRFTRAPRLVLTVVTIALGQAVLGFALTLPELFGFEPDPDTGLPNLPTVAPTTPFGNRVWKVGDIFFNGNQLAAVAFGLVFLVGLAVFLRFTRVGTAVRGAAENRDRAGQLGIDVQGLSTVVWVIVGTLGAVAALASSIGSSTSLSTTTVLATGAFGIGTLLRGLAPAVVARMDNLPLAVAGGFAVGIFEESVRWGTGQAATVDLVLLIVIVGALLFQRRGESRVVADAASSWEATEEVRGVPHELAKLPIVLRGTRRFFGVVAVVVALFPWVMSPTQTNLGSLYAIYGIVGVSLVVLTGWGGQISLGQFGFVAVGAVVGGWFTAEVGMPFLLAVLLGALVTAAVAILVGLPALRIQGLFLAVSSLAFAVVASTFLVNPRYFDWLLPDTVRRPKLLWVDTALGERPFYYLCLVFLAFAIFAAGGLRQSRTGRLLIAMRENERAAQSFTINLVRTRLTAFAMSGFLAGLAGVLYAHHQNGVAAASFAPSRSVDMFLMAVLGGLGSVYAVLVGAVYLATTNIVIANEGGQLLASSLGVLAILLFFPTGLGSLVFRLRDGWLRRIAMRNRILVPTLITGRLKEGDEARVPIAGRGDDAAGIARHYELDSTVASQGRSQQARVWRY